MVPVPQTSKHRLTPPPMSLHEWKDKDRSGDGRSRYVRARWLHGLNQWEFHERWHAEAKGPGWGFVRDQPERPALDPEEEWAPLDPPEREDLTALVDVLERKYRRKRVPHALLSDAMTRLEKLGPAPAVEVVEEIFEDEIEWD